MYLGADDVLRFLASPLQALEEDLRRIEGAVIAAGEDKVSDRQVIQNLDRSLQVLQDLARLCVEGSDDLRCQKVEARYLSRHLRLGHLRDQLLGPDANHVEQCGDTDFFG